MRRDLANTVVGKSRFSAPPAAGGNGGNGGLDGNERGALIAQPAVAAPVKPVILTSKQMREIVATIQRIRQSDIPVFLVGETGTGKEVVADLIHQASNRAERSLVKVNCAALPRELVESELFGSRRGSFTSSREDRKGLFNEANGGTLFLDEITEMPIGVQAKLLRALQDGVIRPVGATVDYPVDCRIITSTNRDIEEAVRDGKLREDLMYRISGITIVIPPLRERTVDIVPLAEQFLKYYASRENQAVQDFTAAALEMITHFSWPGNVRQLENAIRRGVLLADRLVDIKHLSLPMSLMSEKPENVASIGELPEMERVERVTIVAMLKQTGGNKLGAATLLGIGRQTLYDKIKDFMITPTEYT